MPAIKWTSEREGARKTALGVVAFLAGVFLMCSCFADPPISVGKDGTILKDGKPFRAIGINYFSAFARTIENPNDTSSLTGLDELAKRKIPFIRFMCGGFWPKDWRLYQENKDEYFRRLDKFVAAAKERNIGLIPSLFWYDACYPDLVGEPRSQWGNPNGKTIAFMRQYVQEVVSRYVNSPAIWAWELGNEYSLGADLPNAADHRPWIHPDLGTAKSRSEADDLTHDMVVTASREFGKAVRAVDKLRPITTGHSLPRSCAQHLRTEKKWTQDSPEEMQTNLIDATPNPIDLVSIHVYPGDRQDRYNLKEAPYAQTLDLCMKAAAKAGKALFVGEFGAPDTEKDGPAVAKKHILELFAAIESTGVPLAALWNFDLPSQEDFVNVTTTNSRSWILEEITRANQRLQEK